MTRAILRATLNLAGFVWCGFCILGPFAFTQPAVPAAVQVLGWILVVATVIVCMALPELMQQSPRLRAFRTWLEGGE